MNAAVQTAARQLSIVFQELTTNASFIPYHLDVLAEIRQLLDLPDDLMEWYQTAAPQEAIIPSFGNKPILFSPDQLASALQGYSFNSITGESISTWNKNWIVIGGEGKYPLVMQKKVANDRTVYYGEVRKRDWQMTVLSLDLEGFLQGLSDYMRLYLSKYNGVIIDDDSVLLSSFEEEFSVLLDTRASTAGRAQDWLQGWLGY